jgi:hypothetical protein
MAGVTNNNYLFLKFLYVLDYIVLKINIFLEFD